MDDSEPYDEIDYKAIAKSVAKSAVTTLKARECPSAKMDVIIENGFGGVIFHEACGHGLEATSVSKNLSVFSGKKGKKVASDIVNAYDDGTIDGAWGSGNFDDEGNKTQNKQLIKNGVLQTYLYNLKTAYKDGVTTTGTLYAPADRNWSNTNYLGLPKTWSIQDIPE
mgnify:CR=1 FL=1